MPSETLRSFPAQETAKQRYRRSAQGKQQTNAAQRERRKTRAKDPIPFIGIDGEGKGRDPHIYTLLAAADEQGREWHIERDAGLDTAECLELILSLPARATIVAYSFHYDLTMMLRRMSNKALYHLFRPETRLHPRTHKPKAVRWREYELNLMATKFTVRRGNRRRVVWDIWKFFQGKFTAALTDWQILTPDEIALIDRMKNQRGEFDRVSNAEIRAYCLSECKALATLARKLTEAHIEAGYPLKSYYGAGSTASAVLDAFAIKEQRSMGPLEMQTAIASAFFGGRFENSVLGPVEGPVHSYDISSAYPYQLTQLPCLQHGAWRYTTKREELEAPAAALVHYSLGAHSTPSRRLHAERVHSWGPFPFRLPNGTIVFPLVSGGGWVWRDEYLQGERQWSNVGFRGAWIYERACDCRPFAQLSWLYRERCRIGKEGKGIVLKLGPNSVYGKLAQSVGRNPPYQCWIWAGMITSGTRAQILAMHGLHRDPSNLLMVATDGIYSRELLDCPKPLDTGTYDLPKPLGGWEHKVIESGVFAARPGVYFPQNPTLDQLKEVRGRGLGKKVMLDYWQIPVTAHARGETSCKFPDVVRFCGAISSITKTSKGYNRAATYGQWVNRPVELSLNPLPKRLLIGGQLVPHRLDTTIESAPYDAAILSPEAWELRQATLEALEQPDGGDLTEEW